MPDLEQYAKTVRGFRSNLGDEDMNPLVYVERDGALIATLFAQNVSKVEGLMLARYAAFGFAADAVVFAADMRMVVGKPGEEALPVNPVSGQVWKQGQMQALAEDGAAQALGITDCVVLICAERGVAGVKSVALPYRVAAGSVDFLHGGEAEHITSMSGGISDALLSFFAEQTLESRVAANPLLLGLVAAAEDLTPQEQLLHIRCTVVKYLMALGFAVLLHPQSDLETEVYARSLPQPKE